MRVRCTVITNKLARMQISIVICLSQVVTTRQVEERSVSDCRYPPFPPSHRLDILDIASYIILGSAATLAFFLSITTYYYRR